MILSPESTLTLMKMNMLSPDGKCFSFDERANGYSRGEGVSVVIIKRLRDALQDGNTIRAVIRSTGSNQDGHTPGVTQPNKDAQALLIKQTYYKARLDLAPTRYCEAHGEFDAANPDITDQIGVRHGHRLGRPDRGQRHRRRVQNSPYAFGSTLHVKTPSRRPPVHESADVQSAVQSSPILVTLKVGAGSLDSSRPSWSWRKGSFRPMRTLSH